MGLKATWESLPLIPKKMMRESLKRGILANNDYRKENRSDHGDADAITSGLVT